MNSYQSIATINSPEFINLQPVDLNPGMAKCEIKVLYLGNNRNKTSITKDTAREMAKTLRGAPIVGYYRKDKEDFFDHGEQITMDGDGIHFKSLTRPYGFVSPDAEVWFQDFEDTDDQGRSVIRTYLMTTGYLWAGQYEEAKQILEDGGKPHSMELEKDSLQGFWSKDINSNCEFFIINDAIFSKLCILGDDVEPCFEGSSITAPNVSNNFALDDKFKKTLFSMMQELQDILQGGDYTVEDKKKKAVDSSVVTEEEPVIEEPVTEPTTEPTVPGTDSDNSNESSTEPETVADSTEESGGDANSNNSAEGSDGESGDSGSSSSGSSDYVKEEDKEDEKDEEASEGNEDSSEDKETEKDDKDEDEAKKKYALIEEELNNLKVSFDNLKAESEATAAELAECKTALEAYQMKEKDALIEEFSMLSEEDKKDVIEHKAEYSLADIKSKLAVLCYDKQVSYTKADDTQDGLTVNVVTQSSYMPEWLQAVENRRKEVEQ
jgi:hypothetical protein